MRDTCRDQCTMEGSCVSFNIGPAINDKVLCQLSDSDYTLHPDDQKHPLEENVHCHHQHRHH